MRKAQYIGVRLEELAGAIIQGPIKDIFEETESEILLEGDAVSCQVKLLHQGKPWLRYKLRDRRFDGPGWKQTPLTDWTYGGVDDKFVLGRAVEESVYCLDPRYPLTDIFSPTEAQFIANPFEELPYGNASGEALLRWLIFWQNIIEKDDKPCPGYFALKNIPKARALIHQNVVSLLEERTSYDYLTAVPTWWHTARICEHLGFKFQYPQDAAATDKLNSRLPCGNSRERSHSSWIVMLQFWAELAESAGYSIGYFSADGWFDESHILRDEAGKIITFPLSPKRNLWQMFAL